MEEKIKQNNEENQGTTVKKLEGEKKANSLVFFFFIMSCMECFFSQEMVMTRT